MAASGLAAECSEVNGFRLSVWHLEKARAVDR